MSSSACVCEFPSLSFFGAVVCVSVANEHSCRINSCMIKQLQVSTYVKHRVGMEQCGGGQKKTKRMQKGQIEGQLERRAKGVRKSRNVGETHIILRLVWETGGAPTSFFSLSLGRPCSPLSALGERKWTKDLLLGPDLYTFLVLFFSPRPLGHTKGL